MIYNMLVQFFYFVFIVYYYFVCLLPLYFVVFIAQQATRKDWPLYAYRIGVTA